MSYPLGESEGVRGSQTRRERRVCDLRTEAEVLGAVTVRVYDTSRAGEDALSVESGLFLSCAHGLEVFLMVRGERFIIVPDEMLLKWRATPARVVEVTEVVSLILREDGSATSRLYRGNVPMDACVSFDVFAAVPGVVS